MVICNILRKLLKPSSDVQCTTTNLVFTRLSLEDLFRQKSDHYANADAGFVSTGQAEEFLVQFAVAFAARCCTTAVAETRVAAGTTAASGLPATM